MSTHNNMACVILNFQSISFYIIQIMVSRMFMIEDPCKKLI
jgi:hypothetical protein